MANVVVEVGGCITDILKRIGYDRLPANCWCCCSMEMVFVSDKLTYTVIEKTVGKEDEANFTC